MRKKLAPFSIFLIILLSLIACNDKDEYNFFGTYTFDEISYLSGLSSTTKDYREEQLAGTKYIINEKQFKIENANDTVDIASPDYVKEEIPTDNTIFSDVSTFIDENIEVQYTIYEKDGSKTNLRLFFSTNNLWISSYVDNTADGSEIIMDIIKISK
jgi:hypothetical protein